MEIWAHRGASGYAPENTMEAFLLGIEQGAYGIELDVQLTRDGHVVVAHDEKLERVSNGHGLVKDHTLEELKSLDFSAGFPTYGRMEIPTLGEVFEAVKASGAWVNVELKTGLFPYLGIEEKVLKLAAGYEMEGRVIYSSFNHFTLRRIRRLSPQAEIDILFQDYPYEVISTAKQVEAAGIHAPYYYLNEVDLISACREQGIPLRFWTVNEREDMEFLEKQGVKGIFTNYPDLLYK